MGLNNSMVHESWGTNRSIYLFTPERPRDLSARAPGPACQEYYNIITHPGPGMQTELPLLKPTPGLHADRTASFETSQDGVNISEHISRALPQSKEFCVLLALYGLVSYLGSLTLNSSGHYKIRWLNLILNVVAAILAAWLAKFLTSLLA